MGPPIATKPLELPELVRDSKLQTTLTVDSTVHVYYDRPGRRAEPKREIWKKERLIGSGGNGVVWLEKQQLAASSRDGNQARYRAVKQITLAQSTSVLAICKSELEALAKFSTRKYAPWFVQLFGWYECSGLLSIAMEYCPLGDLQQFLIEHPRPLERDIREIIGQVVEGLQSMHDERFAHRDLKPGNILIKSRPPEHDWWVKIGDMGLSKRIEGAGTATTAVKGTPGFFAPEQLGLGGTDPTMADPFKTDIWCLGELTFRMLCGEAAFPSYNDLRKYYQRTVMFPEERLHKMGVTEPAVSFVMSAMLVEPQSRLDAHQAFNHEWLNVNNDYTTDQTEPSHPDLDPSRIEPNRDPYLAAEPSGAWSTVSLPLRPSGTEATEETVRPSSVEGRQHSEGAPLRPLSHHAAEAESDKETLNDPQTISQAPGPQDIEPVVDAETRRSSPRSHSGVVNQNRTSKQDESPSIADQGQRESGSPEPTTTEGAGPPTIRVTEAGNAGEAGDAKEEIKSGHSIEPSANISEPLRQLIQIENDFDHHLQPRSMDFVKYAIVDPKQRDAEYQWLHDAIMTNILLRVDGIESQGNATIQVKRKSLIYQANMMLNRLVLAKRRFDKQEKGRERVEPGEASSRPLFQERTLRERERERRRADSENQSIIAEAGHPISVKHKGKHRTPMIESSPETSDDDVVYARARRYTDNVGNAIRYLQASTARTPPATSRPEGLIPNGPNLDEANDSTSPLGRSRAGQRPSTPSPDERLPTPRYNRGPSTPSPDERRPTPRYNRGPSTPLFNERPSTPSPDERLPTPRFNRGPSTPLLNERPSTPSADERRPTPRFNRGPSTPLFNERPSTPLFNELSTSSFSETSSPSISSLDAVYEPTRPRRVYSRRVPTDSSTGNRAYSPPYTSVGEYAHSSTLKPPAAILGITGKEPGPPLSRSSVLEWLSGVDVNRRDNGSPN